MANNSARYTMVAAKNRWEEQGFFLDDSLPNYSLEQIVYNCLNELGWFRFARQPARANLNWVHEFYTNNPAGDDEVTMCGRRVAANAATINNILDLPNTDPSIYALIGGLEDVDYETIKDYLCQEGTAWNTTGRNPHSVSRMQLLPEAKLWNTFVKRNLMPTSHNQTVDRTRLVLIHVILTGEQQSLPEPVTNTRLRRWAGPRKMDVAKATPIRMAMPTPPASPAQPTVATHDDAEPSTRPGAQPSPAATQQPSEAHSPTSIPAAPTPVSPLGSTTTPPSSPPPAQSDEAIPLHILQLRNQLQRIEARQLQFQSETKPIPSANPSAKAGNTEEVHLSSDDENDIFDWQTPRGFPLASYPTQATAASARQSPDPADVPILQPAPIPAHPSMETHHQRKGKAPAGRLITRFDPSSPEEEAAHQPAQKRRRRHIITSDSDDDCSAAVPTSSADPSLSFTF
ncbi:hypothetical protein V6N13_008148 [Hibiscus sabdariffa]|uniref:Putative plant transposon protein domain-containing protein n=1 Tax=Hibiscus sabdariffa TaxID=183260 RepID=A0ABR2ECE0_9ROSI